jgi:hypothetical protein
VRALCQNLLLLTALRLSIKFGILQVRVNEMNGGIYWVGEEWHGWCSNPNRFARRATLFSLHPPDHLPTLPSPPLPTPISLSAFAGQEKYHSLAPMYYRGAAAAIIVYDITKTSSFNTLKNWVRELQQLGPENIVIAVCGNKADLEEKRVRCHYNVTFIHTL